MNLEQIKAKFRAYPIVAICGLLAAILLGIVYTRLGAVDDLRGQASDLESRWRKIQTNEARASGFQEQVDEMKALGEKIVGKLITPADKAANLDFFYGIEKSLGGQVRILSATQRRADQQQAYAETIQGKHRFEPVGFDLTLEGSFPGVVNFLHTLYSGPHYCRIDSLNIAVPKKGAESGVLEVRLQLELLGHKSS